MCSWCTPAGGDVPHPPRSIRAEEEEGHLLAYTESKIASFVRCKILLAVFAFSVLSMIYS